MDRGINVRDNDVVDVDIASQSGQNGLSFIIQKIDPSINYYTIKLSILILILFIVIHNNYKILNK